MRRGRLIGYWAVLVLLSFGCGAEPVVREVLAKADAGSLMPLDRSPIDREGAGYRTSYAPVLKTAKEAVVAVHSASILRVIRQRGMDPRQELLRRFFGYPPSEGGGEPEIEERRMQEGIGSGVVISPDGYILTNNHVIAARGGAPADEILVELSGGREYRATLVGRDPQSDLAVLKIEAGDLAFLPIADSGNLEVGDIVFAVGNPMGVGLTITQGIVSATQRGNLKILGDDGYESFIQTDAPINPGNSGGALVDAYGRLVGINTAIVSRSGGSVGIGFAIPSTFARQVALDLIRYGEARRGLLGVRIEDLNRDFAEAFQVPERAGAFVQAVASGLAADEAGLQAGDVIVALDAVPVRSATELRLRIGELAPGAKVGLSVRREGQLLNLSATLSDPKASAATGVLLDGIEVTLREAAQGGGIVVTAVAPDSPYASGFAEGMVILEINGTRPSGLQAARQLLQSRPVSRLYVFHEENYGYLTVRSR